MSEGKWTGQELLWWLADQDDCDGECDTEPLYERCPECLARSAINEIGEIIGERLDEIGKSSIAPVKHKD